MLFNCFHCGRSISSKKHTCVYCKSNVTEFVVELQKTGGREHSALKEKYSGTVFSFLLKTKTNK